MYDHRRDIILLLKKDYRYPDQFMEATLLSIHKVVETVDNFDVFFAVHELVKRNRITHKKRWLADAAEQSVLKPFWFLINKN